MRKNLIQTFVFLVLSLFSVITSKAQEKGKLKGAALEANQYVFEGNNILTGEQPDVLSAEKNYRRAIATDPKRADARYNMGVSHYATKNFQEAATRFSKAAKIAKTESERSAAYYNEGNAHMELKDPDKAIEAYKNALRNNPYDNDARKNLAVAKKMKEQQDQNKDQNQDQNKDQQQKDDNKKEDKEKDSDNKKDGENSDEGEDANDAKEDSDKDKKEDDKEGEAEKDDENKLEDDDPNEKEDPKEDENKNDKEGDKSEGQDRRPVEGQLSPDQVKSLLDAMADEEKKVQEKMNAKKVKGARVKSEKDW